MDRDITGAYTKSSTSGSISSCSDLSIEEHINSISTDSIPLDQVIPYLTKHHSFIYFTSKGHKAHSMVYFTESLNILHILTDKNKMKKVFTPDILDISAGICIQVKRESENIYPINIRTRNKVIVLGSKNLNDRDFWYSCAGILLKYAKECFSSVGLRRYCDCVVKNKENEEEIIKMRENQYIEWLKVRYYEREVQSCEKESIRCLMNEIISTVELNEYQQSLKHLERKVLNLIGDKFLLKQSQGNLLKSLQQKETEIQTLTDSFASVRNHLITLSTQFIPSNPWKSIIPFLSFVDLMILKGVNKKIRKIIFFYLRNKSNWRKIVSCTLYPRKISWRLYVNNFYDTEIAAMGQEVLPGVIEEIKQDVIRGLPDQFEEVEEILIGVCALFPNVGYCQGMQQVAHFLLGAFRDSNEVLGALLNLLRPPFYLGDLWKTGFTRLKLGIFQLKCLLKLKLPFMAKHLKFIDIRLDVIVTPWLLTVFTCFIAKQVPLKIVHSIWDLFFVYGWPALISASLALFSIYQEHVLGLDLEDTLRVFSGYVNCNYLLKEIKKYEVSQNYLDELEKAFCLKEDAYA
ncbi:hypothetical protein SteCoe_23834 [Stentor coeruleus]|uniref:Rab-GAP TBC domain-containing protein n=1 Tax=Stentor coeruleus TaxID=5963 RepID=A0A1R2BJ02_9CILI|nr:hypothetical protein SteCoe_23834 [Stentor coeruleus]